MNVKMSWVKIGAQAKANVNEVLNSGWLSRRKFIPLFEQKIAKLHGAKRGIFVNSGTDALRIALLTLKEIHKWRDDAEVLIPGLTFVASANAVLQSGLKPVFVDVQRATGNIEPAQIAGRATRSTVAVLAVHLFGQPASMRAVMQIAKERRLKVLEDSCETLGVHKMTGDAACFSFYQSHHVQTGVGGMIVTNSPKIESVARSYMNHGRTDDGSHFEFGRIGYSSRATEMEAAIGVAGLNELQENLERRRSLAKQYLAELLYYQGIWTPAYSSNHSWMFMPILVAPGGRDRLLRWLRYHGVESREAMPLINQPCYKKLYRKGTCPNAEYWTENGLLLPLHPMMTTKDVKFVCDKIRGFF